MTLVPIIEERLEENPPNISCKKELKKLAVNFDDGITILKDINELLKTIQ